MNRWRFVYALALFAGAVSSQRTTWVVDQSGGGQFTDVQSAIQVAQPGDRVVVRGAFTYPPFSISMGIDVEATQGASVGRITISGVPVGQSLWVSGFHVNDPAFGALFGGVVSVDACRGTVHLGPLRITTQMPTGPTSITTSLRVTNCDAVLLTDVTARVLGERIFMPSATDGAALAVANSAVTAQRCTLTGQHGHNGTGLSGWVNEGGAGAVLDRSRVWFSNCSVTGGDGGNAPFTAGCEANGGDAVVGNVGLAMANCTLTGGRPGQNTRPPCGARAGYAAAGRIDVTADCTTSGGLVAQATVTPSIASLSSPGQLTQGQPATLTVNGAPGTLLLVVFDGRHANLPLPGLREPLLVSPAFQVLGYASVGANGSVPLTFTLPIDPFHRDTFIYFQGLALAPGNQLSLTNLGDFRIR